MSFRKNDAGKPQISLVPPDYLIGLARVLSYGAKKYSASNWCAGADWSRYLDAALRHLLAFAAGEDVDEESGLPTIDHAAACIAFLSAYQKRGIGADDRQKLEAHHALAPDEITSRRLHRSARARGVRRRALRSAAG